MAAMMSKRQMLGGICDVNSCSISPDRCRAELRWLVTRHPARQGGLTSRDLESGCAIRVEQLSISTSTMRESRHIAREVVWMRERAGAGTRGSAGCACASLALRSCMILGFIRGFARVTKQHLLHLQSYKICWVKTQVVSGSPCFL